jgi:hypothetical protein
MKMKQLVINPEKGLFVYSFTITILYLFIKRLGGEGADARAHGALPGFQLYYMGLTSLAGYPEPFLISRLYNRSE